MNSQETLPPTPEAIAALIASTYSEGRPDPYEPSGEAKAVIDALQRVPDIPGEEIVAYFWVDTEGPPPWEPQFAEKLENYLDER